MIKSIALAKYKISIVHGATQLFCCLGCQRPIQREANDSCSTAASPPFFWNPKRQKKTHTQFGVSALLVVAREREGGSGEGGGEGGRGGAGEQRQPPVMTLTFWIQRTAFSSPDDKRLCSAHTHTHTHI